MAVAGAGAGDVGVVIVDPQGRRDTVEVMLEDKGDSTFRCTYRPALQGPHLVHVTYAGAQIPRSPFTVNVAEGESGPPTWPRHLHRWPPVAPRWPHGPPMSLGSFWDRLVPRWPQGPPNVPCAPVAPPCPQGVPTAALWP